MKMEAQQATRSAYRGEGKALDAVRSAAEISPQSEVERLLSKLRTTAEDLDDITSRLVGSVEKVTRSEPPLAEGSGSTNPVASTILGRNLDDLNNKLRNSLLTLQSTVQRIEL